MTAGRLSATLPHPKTLRPFLATLLVSVITQAIFLITHQIYRRPTCPFWELFFYQKSLVKPHSKNKSTSEHLFWSFRLSQIEGPILYLEGPNGILKQQMVSVYTQ